MNCGDELEKRRFLMLKKDLIKVINEIPDNVNLRLAVMLDSENDATQLLQKLRQKKHGVILEQNAFSNWEISIHN